MSPAGPVQHSRPTHSGRPSHQPSPVADQYTVTREVASSPVPPGGTTAVTRPCASYSVLVFRPRPPGSSMESVGRPFAQSYWVSVSLFSLMIE